MMYNFELLPRYQNFSSLDTYYLARPFKNDTDELNPVIEFNYYCWEYPGIE